VPRLRTKGRRWSRISIALFSFDDTMRKGLFLSRRLSGSHRLIAMPRREASITSHLEFCAAQEGLNLFS
jgi:hypothetical protein